VSDPRRAEFEGLVAAINAAADAGEWDIVSRLTDLALALSKTLLAEQGLTSGGHLGQNEPMMTQEQRHRRGRAVARAKASNDLARAVVDDPQKRWRSMTDFAKHLGISKQSLSRYTDEEGSNPSPCPARIAEQVRRDFPGLKWKWPGGVTD